MISRPALNRTAPSPLRGGVGGGGKSVVAVCGFTPPLSPPRQGEGEAREPRALAKEPHDIVRGSETVLVQGITGKQGTFWSERMRDYGTKHRRRRQSQAGRRDSTWICLCGPRAARPRGKPTSTPR